MFLSVRTCHHVRLLIVRDCLWAWFPCPGQHPLDFFFFLSSVFWSLSYYSPFSPTTTFTLTSAPRTHIPSSPSALLTNLNHAPNSQIRLRCFQGHGKQDRLTMVGKSGRYQAYTRRQDVLPVAHSQEGINSGFAIVARRQGAAWRTMIVHLSWTKARP